MHSQKRKKYMVIMLVVITIVITITKMYSMGVEGKVIPNATSESLYSIEQEEIEMIMAQNKALVANEITREYEVEYDSNFWEKQVGGSTPQEKLYQTALQIYYQTKAEQILANKWGIEENISYKAFLEEFDEENKKREQMLKEGKVIYGPKKYTKEQYYAYRNSNRRITLEEYILKNSQITSEDIESYYELNKDQLYIKPNTYELFISKLNEQGNIVETHVLVLDEENTRTYSKTYWEFIQKVFELKEGEQFKTTSYQGEVYEVNCQKISSNGYMLLEEVQDHIKNLLAKEELNSLIEPILQGLKGDNK